MTVTYDTTDYAGETTRDAKDTVKDAAVHAAEKAKSSGGRFTDAVEDLIMGDSDRDGTEPQPAADGAIPGRLPLSDGREHGGRRSRHVRRART